MNSSSEGKSVLSPIEQFACEMIDQHRNDGYPGDVDGGWMQDRMIALGMLKITEVTEPCSETDCVCAETDGIPGECYRLTPDMLKLLSVWRRECCVSGRNEVTTGTTDRTMPSRGDR